MYRAVKKWQGIVWFMFKCDVNIAMFAVQVIKKQGWMFLAMKKQKSIIDVTSIKNRTEFSETIRNPRWFMEAHENINECWTQWWPHAQYINLLINLLLKVEKEFVTENSKSVLKILPGKPMIKDFGSVKRQFKQISIVSVNGMLVNKFSTSNEAIKNCEALSTAVMSLTN